LLINIRKKIFELKDSIGKLSDFKEKIKYEQNILIKTATGVNNEGYLDLKNTGRPRFIKDSVMEEFERELIKIKTSLNPKLFIDHETLFKQSIAAMLENLETFDLLEY